MPARSINNHPQLNQKNAPREDGGVKRASHRMVKVEVGLRAEPLNPGFDENPDQDRKTKYDKEPKCLHQDAQDGLGFDCLEKQCGVRENETKGQRLHHQG